MSITVVSTPRLATKVAEQASLPGGVAIAPVRELTGMSTAACDATDLLGWMGWMTAGPPTLAAETLRSAGLWAWVRYFWAIEDRGGAVRPTPDARSIRQHSRSMFSESVGVGAAGYLGCARVLPSGTVAVANLDDTIELLLSTGLIKRRYGFGKKQPDYLIARGLDWGPLELLAIECKGTVKNESTAISQLAAGVRQVLGIESGLPMRRIVFATSLELDGPSPRVRSHAIEINLDESPRGELDPEKARNALLDVALVRALRCAGQFQAAARAQQGYVVDFQALPALEIGGRQMAGNRAELTTGTLRLSAEAGVDIAYLRALATPTLDRRARLESVIGSIPDQPEGQRQRTELPGRLHEEAVMRDGVGLRFEISGETPLAKGPEEQRPS